MQALQAELQLSMLEGLSELLAGQKETYSAVTELKMMILAKLEESGIEVSD